MTRTSFVKAAVAMTAMSFAPVVAQAQTTNTLLSFNGAVNIQDPNPAANASTGQLFIDFLVGETGNGFGTPGTIQATSRTNLIGVVEGVTQGTAADLTVSPTGFANLPVSPFVTIGGFTFTLTGQDGTPNSTPPSGFGPISLTQRGSTVFADFAVNGTVVGTGLNPGSRFTGGFSAQFANTTAADLIARIDRGETVNTSFAAQFSIQNAAVIPEPSTYALLGSGVAMLGFYARRRRQA